MGSHFDTGAFMCTYVLKVSHLKNKNFVVAKIMFVLSYFTIKETSTNLCSVR